MNPKYFPSELAFYTKKRNIVLETSETREIKKYNEEELKICAKILKIPMYFLFFSPIKKYSFLNAPEKYILVYREDLLPFYDFFEKCTEKERKMRILASYRHLIRGCQLLNHHGIVYENYEKIGFNRQNQPILFDFERNKASLQYLPLEAHVLSFIKNNDVVSLSKSNIEQICENFLKMYIFNHAKPTLRECMSLFVHLINQPKQAIINEMEKYKNTWNYYGISYLYLELLNQVEMPVFFVDILFECIHVDFNSRLSNVLHRLELGDGDV